MPTFCRSQVEELRRFLELPPELIIAIFGPRQTGKTTIALQALERTTIPCRYLAVDEPDRLRLGAGTAGPATDVSSPRIRVAAWLVGQWEAARLEAERSERGFVLVLDEIQKIPDWSGTVKGLWDADRRRRCALRVVILGSVPLLMQSGLNESLAGRFFPLDVTHWAYEEMSQAFGFSLDEYLFFGGYPSTGMARRNQRAWRQYVSKAIVDPAIERDLVAMTRIDKPALLRQLLETGSSFSGQIVSYTKLLGQLQDAGNTTTLARYLQLLSRVGLLAGLPKYSKGIPRRRASSPKLNVLNSALLTVFSPYGFDDARNDRSFWGRVVESAVGAHLLNTVEPGTTVHYWRHGNFEVDFVLERGPRVVAIEVKSSLQARSLKGMQEFKRRFNPHRSLLVGANGVPIDQFLSEPAERWLGRK